MRNSSAARFNWPHLAHAHRSRTRSSPSNRPRRAELQGAGCWRDFRPQSRQQVRPDWAQCWAGASKFGRQVAPPAPAGPTRCVDCAHGSCCSYSHRRVSRLSEFCDLRVGPQHAVMRRVGRTGRVGGGGRAWHIIRRGNPTKHCAPPSRGPARVGRSSSGARAAAQPAAFSLRWESRTTFPPAGP